MNKTFVRFFKEYNKAVKYDFQGRVIAVAHNVKSYAEANYKLNR